MLSMYYNRNSNTLFRKVCRFLKMFCRGRRTKSFILGLALFILMLFIGLNVVIVELNSENAKLSVEQFNDYYDTEGKLSKIKNYINELRVNNVAQGQRLPKTTNNENNPDSDYYDDVKNKISEQTKNNQIKKLDHTYYENEDIEEETDDVIKEFDNDSNKGGAMNKVRETFSHNNKFRDSNAHNNVKEEGDGTDLENVEDIEDLDEDYENDDDDYEYDDNPPEQFETNPKFKSGDFGDIRGLEFYNKPKLKYEEVKAKTKDGQPIAKDMKQQKLVENGIYWTSYAESFVPKGLSYANMTKLIHSLRSQVVQKLELPSWDRCGRPRNGYIVLGDGTQICARYRQPHFKFVFGEALSFYLSRLLGMDNVPAVVLATTNSTSQQWRAVNISLLEWEEDKTIAFIQWIHHLNDRKGSTTRIPALLLAAYRQGEPITDSFIRNSALMTNSSAQISHLVQWTTMIIFDYITGNYDRFASMQDAAADNSKVIEDDVRNLRQSFKNGKLWLIDNESGLFDAYELLNSRSGQRKFVEYHRKMLESVCIFQPSLVSALRKLAGHSSPHTRLVNFATSFEPLMKKMPKSDIHFNLFKDMFEKRLKQVIAWIDKCEAMNS